MFSSALSTRRAAIQAAVPNLRAVNNLGLALAQLPAPWKVLRNRRSNAADGPPWVKYMAFHPHKGIALVDLLPAKPDAAILPLEEFLTRTRRTAVPPITAAALAEHDIPTIADALAAAFTAVPRNEAADTPWVDPVIGLLMGTEELLLAPLESNSDSDAKTPRSPARSRPPFSFAATPSSEPHSRSKPRPKEVPQTKREHVEKSDTPNGRPLDREPWFPLAGERDPIWRPNSSADAADFAPRARRLPSAALWVLAATLTGLAGIVLLGDYREDATPHATPVTETLPSQEVDFPAAAIANSAPTPVAPVAAPPAVPEPAAPPTQTAALPPVTAAPQQDAGAPASPAVSATPQPHPAVDERALAASPSLPPSTAMREPEQHERWTKTAHANRPPHRSSDEEGTRRAALAEPPAGEDTIVVGGMTYIRGREPRVLGTVTERDEQSELPPEPAPGN